MVAIIDEIIEERYTENNEPESDSTRKTSVEETNPVIRVGGFLPVVEPTGNNVRRSERDGGSKGSIYTEADTRPLSGLEKDPVRTIERRHLVRCTSEWDGF